MSKLFSKKNRHRGVFLPIGATFSSLFATFATHFGKKRQQIDKRSCLFVMNSGLEIGAFGHSNNRAFEHWSNRAFEHSNNRAFEHSNNREAKKPGIACLRGGDGQGLAAVGGLAMTAGKKNPPPVVGSGFFFFRVKDYFSALSIVQIETRFHSGWSNTSPTPQP